MKTIDISVRYIATFLCRCIDSTSPFYRDIRCFFKHEKKIQFCYYYPNLERTRWWSTRTRCRGTSGKTISTFTIHVRKNVLVSSFNGLGNATFYPFSLTPLDTRHILNARYLRSAGYSGRIRTYRPSDRFGGIQILEFSKPYIRLYTGPENLIK